MKGMKYEIFTLFVTSILELKLDQTTMFKWQRHTQSSHTVPDYDELWEFLDLHARTMENAAQEEERKRQVLPPEKKAVTRPTYMYAARIEDNCVACKTAKHPCMSVKYFMDFPTPRR